MSICPFCNYENIEGTDLCAQCEQPLLDISRTAAKTGIQRDLIKDQMVVLEPKTPTVIAPEAPVGEVLKLMVDQSIGCVLVVEEEKMVGIFTERDALYKLNTDFHRLKDQPVSDFMTENPRSLDAQAKVVFAVQRMDLGGFRHIPIVDTEGRATGIVSVRDILRYLTDKLDKSVS